MFSTLGLEATNVTLRMTALIKVRRAQMQNERVNGRELPKKCLRGDAERVVELLRARNWSTRELQGALNRATTVEVVRAFAEIVPRFFNEEEGGAAVLISAIKELRVSVLRVVLDAIEQSDEDWNRTRPLHVACACGSTEVVQMLLKAGDDINVRTYGLQPLHLAAFRGHADCVHLLLEHGADIHATTNEGHTRLHDAAAQGKCDAITLLVDVDNSYSELQDIRFPYMSGDTPLHLAARSHHIIYGRSKIQKKIAKEGEKYEDCAALLLERGAFASALNDMNATPFSLTFCLRSPNVTRCFIDGVTRGFFETRKGETALHYLMNGDATKENIVTLLNLGIDINCRNEEGITPLLRCAESYVLMADAMEALLLLGADVSASDNTGWTSLHYAASNGFTEEICVLLKAGADINATSRFGETPLHVGYRWMECIDELLDAGADVNARTAEGRTPVHYAALDWSPYDLQKLKQFGADLEAVDARGWTALHEAASMGNFPVILWLLSQGLCLDARTNNGSTPLHLAVQREDPWETSFLLLLRAPVQVADVEGRTPLHLAALGTDTEKVRNLLEFGADRRARDDDGNTPAMLALDPEIRRILEKWAIAG